MVGGGDGVGFYGGVGVLLNGHSMGLLLVMNRKK